MFCFWGQFMRLGEVGCLYSIAAQAFAFADNAVLL